MNITKIIPFNIRIKSLYWVRKEKEIVSDLKTLFSKIDNNEYDSAKKFLTEFSDKWTEISHTAPQWFVLEHMPEFVRAESMLNFLTAPLED